MFFKKKKKEYKLKKKKKVIRRKHLNIFSISKILTTTITNLKLQYQCDLTTCELFNIYYK